jgi:hypothetical protein
LQLERKTKPQRGTKGNTMSTDLVVIQPTAPITQYEEPEDNGNWGDTVEIIPQFLSIRQALTEGADEIPLGKLFHKGTGRTWDSIDMVILKAHKTRTLKKNPGKFIADDPTVCRSENGKTPVTYDTRLTPQAKDCNNCKHNSWANFNRETGEGSKPTCNKGFHFLFIDRETKLPYIYNTSGQGTAPSEAVYQVMFQMAREAKEKLNRMPNSWEFIVTLVTEKGNKAYKPKFTKVRLMKQEDAAEFGAFYKQFVTNYKNNIPLTEEPTTITVDSEDTGAVSEEETTEI